MLKTPTRSIRKRWLLAYQDAAGTPEDEILERNFPSEAEAMVWADDHAVVPLWLDEREELLSDLGQVIGSITERHEI